MVTHIDASNFEAEVLKSAVPVVVDFWAQWCPPCQFLGPVFEKVAKEFEGRVKFCKLDVDRAPAIAQQFGVSAIPTLIIFKSGQEAGRQMGALPEDALRDWIQQNAL